METLLSHHLPSTQAPAATSLDQGPAQVLRRAWLTRSQVRPPAGGGAPGCQELDQELDQDLDQD